MNYFLQKAQIITKIAVKLDNKIYGVGIGKSKKEAEKNAAREALEKIEEL